MSQNLKKYPISCPNCEGENFTRGVRLEYGPNGMIEKTGEFVCLACSEKLQLDRAVRTVELEKKQDELRAMQAEMEAMT